MSGDVKYPDVAVELSDGEGNAFAIVGEVARALRSHGIDAKEIDAFSAEAMSGDYDHLLWTCMTWVDVS